MCVCMCARGCKPNGGSATDFSGNIIFTAPCDLHPGNGQLFAFWAQYKHSASGPQTVNSLSNMIRIASILVLALLPNVADSVTCYGDVRRLSPKGASSDTARQDRLSYTGPAASRKILENDYRDLNRMKSCYDRVGRKYCIQPSVIAALASRESRGGRIIQSSNGWGDCKNGRCRAYGILQCDIYSSGLGNRCTQYGWKSCEHIDMMVKDVLLSKIKGVQRKQTSWSKERQLQGGIAAYNFGVSNVQSWERLDKGSTGDDYSGDVVARAKHLIDKYGWQ